MTTQRVYQINYRLKGSALLAYAALAHFENFAHLHPYMRKVRCIEMADKHKDYNIEEELKLFGFFKIRPTYSARVTEEKAGEQIRYVSQVKRNIRLQIDFFVRDQKNGDVLVEECICLQANPVLAVAFYSVLKKAHRMVFAGIQGTMQQDVQDYNT